MCCATRGQPIRIGVSLWLHSPMCLTSDYPELSELLERYRSYIGRYRSYRTLSDYRSYRIVDERVTAAFNYRSYRRGHYRTIGEAALSDYRSYRTTIEVLSELSNYYWTRALPSPRRRAWACAQPRPPDCRPIARRPIAEFSPVLADVGGRSAFPRSSRCGIHVY